MKSSARVTGVATKAARFGLAVVLAACSGQPGAIPVATGPVVQTAASHSSSMPVSVDALPVIVSTSTHTVPLKKIEWPKLPAASAGKAFAHPQVINLLVLDASGKRIVGTYATPIELTDADTSGATHLLINGKPASAKNVLTASTSVVTLSYTGLAIPHVASNLRELLGNRGRLDKRPVRQGPARRSGCIVCVVRNRFIDVRYVVQGEGRFGSGERNVQCRDRGLHRRQYAGRRG